MAILTTAVFVLGASAELSGFSFRDLMSSRKSPLLLSVSGRTLSPGESAEIVTIVPSYDYPSVVSLPFVAENGPNGDAEESTVAISYPNSFFRPWPDEYRTEFTAIGPICQDDLPRKTRRIGGESSTEIGLGSLNIDLSVLVGERVVVGREYLKAALSGGPPSVALGIALLAKNRKIATYEIHLRAVAATITSEADSILARCIDRPNATVSISLAQPFDLVETDMGVHYLSRGLKGTVRDLNGNR